LGGQRQGKKNLSDWKLSIVLLGGYSSWLNQRTIYEPPAIVLFYAFCLIIYFRL